MMTVGIIVLSITNLLNGLKCVYNTNGVCIVNLCVCVCICVCVYVCVCDFVYIRKRECINDCFMSECVVD